jgi:preprotein translocase subunit YajC
VADLKPGDRVITGSGQGGKIVDIDFNLAQILLDSGLRMTTAVDSLTKILPTLVEQEPPFPAI